MRSSLRSTLAAVALAGPGVAGCAGPGRELRSYELVTRAQRGQEPPASPQALDAISFAAAQVGKPYCWGGVGPTCFDCSGLVQTAWRRAGARLPRTSEDIARALPEVTLDEVRAGDILWWPGHVALYAGNGWTIEALDRRHGVVRRPAADPRRAYRP